MTTPQLRHDAELHAQESEEQQKEADEQLWLVESCLTTKGRKCIRGPPGSHGKQHGELTDDEKEVVIQGKGFLVMHYTYIEDPKRVLSAKVMEEAAMEDSDIEPQNILSTYISSLPVALKDESHKIRTINLVSIAI